MTLCFPRKTWDLIRRVLTDSALVFGSERSRFCVLLGSTWQLLCRVNQIIQARWMLTMKGNSRAVSRSITNGPVAAHRLLASHTLLCTNPALCEQSHVTSHERMSILTSKSPKLQTQKNLSNSTTVHQGWEEPASQLSIFLILEQITFHLMGLCKFKASQFFTRIADMDPFSLFATVNEA